MPGQDQREVPASGPADAGSCTSAMSTGLPVRGRSRRAVAGPDHLLGDLSGQPAAGRAVFLSGVNRGSPMPAMVRPATVVIGLSSTIALRLAGRPRRRSGRVVVAADEDVRHLERADRADEGGFRLAAPVGDVPGVDHDVDAELLDDRPDQLPGGRVEVHVGDVQHPVRARVGSYTGSAETVV